MMISHILQAAAPEQIAEKVSADSLKAHSAQLVETLKNTPPNELLADLGQQAIHFGLKVLAALLIYALGAWLIKIVRRMLARGFARKKTEKTIAGFVDSLVTILMWVVVIILAVGTLGVNTTSLAALLAAGGMAIGMALSGTVQNFAGGLMLLIFKPFKAGDFIEAQGFSGIVNEVNIVSTRLTTTDNRVIILPNGALSNGNINNVSANPLRRVDLTVSVEYGSDAAAVKAALLEIIAAQEGTLDAATPGAADPFVALLALKDSSVDFVVRVWVKQEDYWNVFFSLNESVYTLLPSKYGIQFPFPQMDVHIQS